MPRSGSLATSESSELRSGAGGRLTRHSVDPQSYPGGVRKMVLWVLVIGVVVLGIYLDAWATQPKPGGRLPAVRPRSPESRVADDRGQDQLGTGDTPYPQERNHLSPTNVKSDAG